MAWVPSNGARIGQIRTLARDLSCNAGTIKAGSRVEITGLSYRGWYIKDLESGHEIGETMQYDDSMFKPLRF